MQIPDAIKDKLYKAGWSENYEYDVSEYIQLHNFWGCKPPSIVLNFLKMFGGLIIEYPHRVVASRIIKLSLTPTSGLIGLGTDICSDLDYKAEKIEVKKLYFLGWFENHMELLMDESGQVYGSFDELIVKVADTGIDAIEAICNGHDFKKIVE